MEQVANVVIGPRAVASPCAHTRCCLDGTGRSFEHRTTTRIGAHSNSSSAHSRLVENAVSNPLPTHSGVYVNDAI